ncbi:MAG: hypothetical protein WAW86_07125 [Gammaproteobacteria bacterium]
MASITPLYHLIEINSDDFSKEEMFFMDMILFFNLCEELRNIILSGYKSYFFSIKANAEKEKSMLEQNFMSCILNDILSTAEYSLTGIAYYTNTPEEVLLDISTGANSNPTFAVSRKLIDLHRSVKPELYLSLLKKILQSQPAEMN